MTKEEYHQYLLDNINKMNWLPIPGFEGLYEESDWGLTKSLERYKQNHSKLQLVEEKILKFEVNNMGYFMVCLWKNNIKKHLLVSRVVCETFHGPCPTGMECLHGPDHNPWNNHKDNLHWGTRKENQFDRIENGTDARGEKSVLAKLTQLQVNEIRSLYLTGKYFYRELAVMFNVNRRNIGNIINYKSWKYE